MSDLIHDNHPDVETSPANKVADLRFPSLLNESAKREWQLVFPVLCGWLAIFVVLVWEHRGANSEYPWYMLTTHSGVGVAMTIIWTAFYGSASWRRIAISAMLVLCVAMLALYVTVPWVFYQDQHAVGAINERFLWVYAWTPTIAILVGMLPAMLARRFLGWRVFHLRNTLDLARNSQFSLRDTLTWMAYFAVLCTLLRTLLSPFFGTRDPWRNIVGLYLGWGLPLFALMSFLAIAARLKGMGMVIVTPVLAAGLATLACIPVLLDRRVNKVIWDFFVPAQFWYMMAGFGLIGVMAYLRRQGVVFAFGNHDVESLREESTRAYSQRLHKRIDRLQTELDSLQR